MSIENSRYSLESAHSEAESLKKKMSGYNAAKDYSEAERRLENEKEEAEIISAITKKYGEGVPVIHLYSWIRRLREEYGPLVELKEKKVLDLGCGSTLPQQVRPLVDELLEKKENDNEVRRILGELGNIQRGSNGTFSYDNYMNIAASPKLLTKENMRMFEPWFPRLLAEIGAHPVGIDIGNLEDEEFEHYSVDLSRKGSLDFLPNQSFDVIHSRLLFSSPQLENMVGNRAQTTVREEVERQVQRLLKEGGKVIQDRSL